jgi:hypothetical protein
MPAAKAYKQGFTSHLSSAYLDEEALKCYTVEQGVNLFEDCAKRRRVNCLGSLPLK